MRLFGFNAEDISQKRESWGPGWKVFWLFLALSQKIGCKKKSETQEQQSFQLRQKQIPQKHSAAAQTHSGLVSGSIPSFESARRVVPCWLAALRVGMMSMPSETFSTFTKYIWSLTPTTNIRQPQICPKSFAATVVYPLRYKMTPMRNIKPLEVPFLEFSWLVVNNATMKKCNCKIGHKFWVLFLCFGHS